MAITLSEGAIHDIITKPAEEHPQKPVLQILGVRKIQPNQGSKGTDRYRLVLSDGALIHTSAMLATQLNDRVTEGQIEMKAVIQLDKFICNIIQETRKVLIILDCTVVKKASEVPGKIGNPKSAADLVSGQQPQQNGNTKSDTDSFGNRQNTPAHKQPLQQQNKGYSGGGGSFGKGYGSNQPVNRGADGHKTVFPISGLTPYQNRWTIRARVTSKSGIRTWSNSRGEGRLFNVEFVDESGEIRATGFNDAVDKFYELLEVNKVFYITKGSLKTANKQYSSVKNDYEMYLNSDTNVELCTEACDLPSIQYNFISIGDLESVEKDTMVDILGVCTNIADVSQITTRTTNKQVSKRDVTLVDRSEKSVQATLWGEEAEKFEEYVGKTPVLAVKGAKLSDFGGRSLSIMSSSNMMVNPLDLKEAMSLRGWYDNTGKNHELQSISNQRYGDGGEQELIEKLMEEEEQKVPDEFLREGRSREFVRDVRKVFYDMDQMLYPYKEPSMEELSGFEKSKHQRQTRKRKKCYIKPPSDSCDSSVKEVKSKPKNQVFNVLEAVCGTGFFSVLDIENSYWEDWVPEYQRKKGNFQCLVERFLSKLTFDNCVVVLDDVIVHSTTFDQHQDRLREVFELVRNAGLKLNPRNCQFCCKHKSGSGASEEKSEKIKYTVVRVPAK